MITCSSSQSCQLVWSKAYFIVDTNFWSADHSEHCHFTKMPHGENAVILHHLFSARQNDIALVMTHRSLTGCWFCHPAELIYPRNRIRMEKVNFHEFLVNNLKLLYVNKVLIWPCVLLNLHLMTQTFECSCCAETERRLASKHCQIRDVSHASRIWRRLKI